MAASVAISKQEKVPGSERRTVSNVTLDNSYAEGGESLTAKELGLTSVDFAICTIKNGTEAEATPVCSAWYETSKALLHVINAKTQKEVAGAADLSKVIVHVIAFGQ